MKRTSHKIGILLLFLIALLLGLWGGLYVGNKRIQTLNAAYGEAFANIPLTSNEKIGALLQLIETMYVDSLNQSDFVEELMPLIMGELDPHSTYITAADLEGVNNELAGSFSGIGVQFSIQEDTINIVGVVSGGPSEKLGVLPGDRIVTINDSLFVGEEVTNERVMQKLRGEKGSTVTIEVKRSNSDELVAFDIVRDDIPDKSIDASILLDDEVGYIRINRFGSKTYEEFLVGLAHLRNEGAKGYIIDLRGNSGGYMDAAINMINEFLPQGSLIVYAEGNSYERSDARANGYGAFQEVPLVVLVDEFSASASEIFAGAIQDNDRGTIIGRRSYGKGLVQQQIPLADGSAIRLTVARYYTPSGRSVQSSYEMGDEEAYNENFVARFNHGEMYERDSIKLNDSLRYETVTGRTVYGGGGIMPDIFVPSDTTGVTSYLSELVNKGIIYQYALQYTDKHREKLNQYSDMESLRSYLQGQPLLTELVDYAYSKGIKRRPFYINISKEVMLTQLYANIVRNILGDGAFFQIFMEKDKTVLKALDVLERGEAFPEPPTSAKE